MKKICSFFISLFRFLFSLLLFLDLDPEKPLKTVRAPVIKKYIHGCTYMGDCIIEKTTIRVPLTSEEFFTKKKLSFWLEYGKGEVTKKIYASKTQWPGSHIPTILPIKHDVVERRGDIVLPTTA